MISSSGNTLDPSPVCRRCSDHASVREICLVSHCCGFFCSSVERLLPGMLLLDDLVFLDTLKSSPMCHRRIDHASVREICLASHNATGTSLFDISPHPMEDFALKYPHMRIFRSHGLHSKYYHVLSPTSARWRHTTATRIHGLVLHLRIDCAL